MRSSRLLATAAAATVLLGAAGCAASDDANGSSGASTHEPAGLPTTASTQALTIEPSSPALAGAPEARALAPLPAGAATGSAILSYSGVGELRAPFTGSCTHDGGSTHLDGSADTAHITLDVTPTGAQLRLRDVGLSATSDLTTGRYGVSGNHLSLVAHLAHDGQQIGSVQLDATCGG